MTPRLSGHFYIFGLVFFVLRSLLGVGRQYGVVKNNGRILIYRTWAIGIILGRPSTSSGVRIFMDLIGSLLLEWNICPSRPDLHACSYGRWGFRGYPRCNKKITLSVPLSKQTSFSRKAEALGDWNQSAVHFVRSKSILLLYSLKGVSEERSLQEIT